MSVVCLPTMIHRHMMCLICIHTHSGQLDECIAHV